MRERYHAKSMVHSAERVRHLYALSVIVAIAQGCAPTPPWHAPSGVTFDGALRRMETIDAASGTAPIVPPTSLIDRTHAYGLAELVDIAQRLNPKTCVAWERSRQAALAIGLVEAAYQPMLAASLMAGYERAVFPIEQVPGILDENYFSAQTVDVVPSLQLNWLLYDFGRREAARDMAESNAVAARALFDESHRVVGYSVTVAFHAYLTADERIDSTRVAALAAEDVERATRAAREHGLGTDTQVLAATVASLQAQSDVENAMQAAAVRRTDLIEAVGFAPSTELNVVAEAMPTDEAVDAILAEDVATYVTRAIEQRSDLRATIAHYRARQAEVRLARADFNPTVAAGANLGAPLEAFNVESIGWASTVQPWYGAYVGISVPLLDGEMRDTKLQIALAGLSAASAEIAASQHRATREVWNAYAALSTALRQRVISRALIAASERNYAQSLAAFKNGFVTFVEVDQARRSLADALQTDHDSCAALRDALATLALSARE